MPADIRSFFGAKAGAPPSKPAPKKEDDTTTKKRHAKGRRVVEDSDEDEAPPQPKKVATKPTPKKKAADAGQVQGVVISASDYFASSKSKTPKTQSTPATETKPAAEAQVEIRQSPRGKQAANGQGRTKKAVTSYRKHDHDDDDAFMDDDDGGDDIFAADIKGRKRKNDDYEEVSEDEVRPQPKRVASRGRPSLKQDDSDIEIVKSTAARPGAKGKKRKSPEAESEDDDSDGAIPQKKKAATSKPRQPRAKKAPETEDAAFQALVDAVPTVRPPTPPPRDPNAKFDFKKAMGGGGNAGPPPDPGAADIPEGEENCLMGMAFVFTGLLKTIGRDEAQALVKQYGGKVTGAPSSKTTFVVLGDDAGPSKLAKIKQHGIKTIDENGLFHLIRTAPANGGSGKSAAKAQQKREAEEEKAKKQASELDKEEKARRAEAERAQKAAGARGAAAPAAAQANSQLWTSKYAPTQLNHICGNKGQVEKIQSWLHAWPKNRKYDFQRRGADGMGATRAIIISGPPGVGKTTAAHLAAKLEGYDVIESNASDTRSKKLVETGVSDVLNNTSLLGYFAGDGKKIDAAKKKIVLIMDEVDGMSAGDRGGVGALAKLCKMTEVPMILICNERRLPKMKPFDFVATDFQFRRPTVDQIRSRVMTICHREGLKLPPPVVDALIEGSNKDIRQIINMISTIKLDQAAIDFEQSKSMTKAWEKHVILKPWDICQKMLGGGLFSPASKATLNDKIELYFNDHEFSYLMIQENYIRTRPMALNGRGYNRREENLKCLELIDQAAESISDGDLVDSMIHGPQQQWSLMPAHAVFSTVRPASFVAGQMMNSTFTSWLGNHSKTGKLSRYVREIHSHMRLRSSGDHNEIRQQYLPVLWHQLIKRLADEGKESVEDVINLMDSYYLTKEDFDAIKELGVGPQAEDSVTIETQTKAAFTRTYNLMAHPVPFMKASSVVAPKKQAKEMPDLEEAIEEADDADVIEPAEAEDDDELDLKKDKYIKQPKAKPAKKAAKKSAKAAADDDDVTEAKPRGKGKTGAARGRPKKA